MSVCFTFFYNNYITALDHASLRGTAKVLTGNEDGKLANCKEHDESRWISGQKPACEALFLWDAEKRWEKQRRGMDGNVPYCQIVCSPLPVLSLLSTLSMPVEACTYTWHYSKFYINVRCHDMPMILELLYQRWRLKSRWCAQFLWLNAACIWVILPMALQVEGAATEDYELRVPAGRACDMSSDDVTKLLMVYPPRKGSRFVLFGSMRSYTAGTMWANNLVA